MYLVRAGYVNLTKSCLPSPGPEKQYHPEGWLKTCAGGEPIRILFIDNVSGCGILEHSLFRLLVLLIWESNVNNFYEGNFGHWKATELEKWKASSHTRWSLSSPLIAIGYRVGEIHGAEAEHIKAEVCFRMWLWYVQMTALSFGKLKGPNKAFRNCLSEPRLDRRTGNTLQLITIQRLIGIDCL